MKRVRAKLLAVPIVFIVLKIWSFFLNQIHHLSLPCPLFLILLGLGVSCNFSQNSFSIFASGCWRFCSRVCQFYHFLPLHKESEGLVCFIVPEKMHEKSIIRRNVTHKQQLTISPLLHMTQSVYVCNNTLFHRYLADVIFFV